MCGIAGVALAARGVPEAALLRAMCDVMRHRGPDDEGFYAAPGIGLGVRRLSVIDVAGGHQPISNEDGSVWVVLNGEVYNFPALRKDLERAGHRFQTRTDTEAIVHLYEDYGLNFVDHLDGMAGIALWDARRERLVLVRDRAGEKPLYYAELPDRLVFGSEIKCILQDPGVRVAVDPNSFADYIALRFVPAPATMLAGVSQLLPGERAVYERGTLTRERYWRLRLQPGAHTTPRAERDQRFLDTMRRAVRSRLISDVPLGAFLSGGLDSASVVALMCEASPSPVQTFSIGFERRDYDERPFARLVANALGTRHEDAIVEPADAQEILPQLVWHIDDPMGDPSALPTFYLAQMTRRAVTVALTGDGGDELLAGYTHYPGERVSALYRRLLGPLARPASRGLRLLASLSPGHIQARLRRLARLTREATVDPASRYFGKVTYTSSDVRRALLDDERSDHALQTLLACVDANDLKGLDPISYIVGLDALFALPNDILVKVDRMTMAHSLEARAPLLDHHLIELAAQLPLEDKLDGLTTKAILRRTMGRYLPQVTLRRPKQGFNVPLSAWFRGGLNGFARELLLTEGSDIAAYVSRDAMHRLVAEHLEGTADHAEQLWLLMFFEVWHRTFVSRRLPQPVLAQTRA